MSGEDVTCARGSKHGHVAAPPVQTGECDLCDVEYRYRGRDPCICEECVDEIEVPEPRGDPDYFKERGPL